MNKKKIGALVGVMGVAGAVTATQFIDLQETNADYVSNDLLEKLEESANETVKHEDTEDSAEEIVERAYDPSDKVEYIISKRVDQVEESVEAPAKSEKAEQESDEETEETETQVKEAKTTVAEARVVEQEPNITIHAAKAQEMAAVEEAPITQEEAPLIQQEINVEESVEEAEESVEALEESVEETEESAEALEESSEDIEESAEDNVEDSVEGTEESVEEEVEKPAEALEESAEEKEELVKEASVEDSADEVKEAELTVNNARVTETTYYDESGNVEYVATTTVQDIQEAQDFYGLVSVKGLNVRQEPNMDAKILGSLQKGDPVHGEILNGWVKIIWNDQVAYVKASYVETATMQEVEQVQREQEEEQARIEAAEREAAEAAEREAAEAAEREAAEAAEREAAEAAEKEAAEAAEKEAAEKEAAEATEKEGPEETVVATTTSGYTQYSSNIRTGPGTGYRRITTLPVNTYVEGELVNGWVKFTHDGQTAYIKSNLLGEKIEVAEKPVQEEVQETVQEEATGQDAVSRMVDRAYTQVGLPYIYATSRPGVGFDCSGFTRYLYGTEGISLPHSSARQANYGTPVSKSNLQAGDLLFFSSGGGRIDHVGMYIGNGQMIHASSYDRGVVVDSIHSNYYTRTYVTARRIIH